MDVTAQTVTPCDCRGFIDNDHDGLIALYDKPAGKIIRRIKNDLKNEDYLIFDITKVADSFFYVKMKYDANEKIYEGWISKSKYLVTYVQDYNRDVSLYSKPNTTSAVTRKVVKNSSGIFQVMDCNGNWVYLKENTKPAKAAGWLQSDKQCANPYTNCN